MHNKFYNVIYHDCPSSANFHVHSPDLSWRDIQYLIAYTSNIGILTLDDVETNGAGLQFSHSAGFGAIDAEAMVTRARHWTNVPAQISQSFTHDTV